MKKIIGTCLAVLIMFAPSEVAAADTARLATAGGQITSIDTAAKSLVVKLEGGQPGDTRNLTFVVAADAKIVKDGSVVTLNDLEQGDRVTVTYRSQDGKNLVGSIGVAPKVARASNN